LLSEKKLALLLTLVLIYLGVKEKLGDIYSILSFWRYGRFFSSRFCGGDAFTKLDL
jgi:hypothetical protein